MADNKHLLVWDLLVSGTIQFLYLTTHFLGLLICFPPISRKGKNVKREHELDPENLHQAFPWYTLNFFPFHLSFVSVSGKPRQQKNLILWRSLTLEFVRQDGKNAFLRTETSITGHSQPRKEMRLFILSQICLLREGGISWSPRRTPLNWEKL